MKPKYHKSIQRHKQRNKQLTVPGDDEVTIELDKSDTDENNATELESKSFAIKCSRELSCQNSPKTGHEKHTNKNFDNNDIASEADRYNVLFQSVRDKRDQLVKRLKIYNGLFKFHKTIKEDQVYLYRKLHDLDEVYLRNTAVILRLGFCPCLVHQQTSPVGDALMKIHKKLRVWDKKMEQVYDILKEPSTRKSTTAVLQILKISDKARFMDDSISLNDIELPEIVWDLENPFLEQFNTIILTEDWKNARQELRESLCKAEMEFQEICLEFGITRGPELIPLKYENRPFTYENLSMSHDDSQIDDSSPGNVIEESGDGKSVDSSSSELSSSSL